MKKIDFAFLPVFIIIIFQSCMNGPDKKLLPGDWTGAEWLVDGQTSGIDASVATFSFHEDGTYSYAYADAREVGKYFITGNELYTTPDGGIKMMVKIEKLTPDTLVFNMNRGGMAERLTLVKNH